MAVTIKLKNASGSDPGASDLVVGEVALRTDNGKLFTKKDDNSVVEISGSGGVSDGDKGDITVSSSGAVFTIDSGVVNNAKVASDAAIAGTKISPDFGSQNVVTTGNLTLDSDSNKLIIGDDGDIEIFHDGSHSHIMDKGTGNLAIHSNGAELQLAHNNNAGTFEHMVRCITSGAVELYHNGSDKFATNSSGAEVRGNLDVSAGIDVTGISTFLASTEPQIVVQDSDSGNTGNAAETSIQYKDGGGTIQGQIGFHDSGTSHLFIDTSGTSQDILCRVGGSSTQLRVDNAGIDVTGGITATALSTFSASGSALRLNDDSILRLGNDDADYFQYYDGSSDIAYLSVGSSRTFRINTDDFRVFGSGNTEEIIRGQKDGNVQLFYDNAVHFRTEAGGAAVVDGNSSISLRLEGSGGTAGYLTGDGSTVIGLVDNSGHYHVKGTKDGATELYYDNSLKFITESTGVKAFGMIVPSADNSHVLGIDSLRWQGLFMSGDIDLLDSDKIKLGASDDLQIYHDGSNSYITSSTNDFEISSTGDDLRLYAADDIGLNVQSNEAAVKCKGNGSVELYYDNSKKAETVSGGFTVTGTCTATTFSGSGSSLTSLPAGNLTGTLPAISGANLTNLPSPTVENAAFAWINFNSTNNSIRGSYNVSSISDHGTGNFSVNFTNNASNNNYAVQINGTNTTSNTAISFLLSASGPNLNSNAYSDGNFSTSAFRWVMGYGPSSVSMDTNLVCATVHES